jgi:pyridoxine kinase
VIAPIELPSLARGRIALHEANPPGLGLMKTVLSIQSQVAASRVGNSVACFALERLGVRAIALPTTLYGRRPDKGAPGGGPAPAGLMAAMLDALDAEGLLARVDAVLSGYIAQADQAEIVLDAALRVKKANPQAIYVCDPVMGDAEGGLFVNDEIADKIVNKMAPMADLVTPNAWELETMSGFPANDLAAARIAAKSLGRAVLVTSAPSATGVGALYSAANAAWLVETPRAPKAPKGTGDLFTALFLAHRLNGRSIAVALEAAAGATYDVILRSLANGDGELAIIEAQDKLVDPDTWPTAQPLGD